MKKDLLALTVVLALAIALVIIQEHRAEPASYALIKVGGEIILRYPLDVEHQELIKTDHGSNLVQIKDGYVYVLEANCPDQRCIRQGKICHSGAVIACIPHGLLIVLEGGQSGIDAVSQ